MKNMDRPNRCVQVCCGKKEAISAHRLLDISMETDLKKAYVHLYKKNSGTLKKRFFSARVVIWWNGLELDVAVDTIEKFKR